MPQQTSSSIVIAAAPEAIMQVIADVEDYPEWTAGLEVVTRSGSDEEGRPLEAHFSGSLGPVKDSYSVAYDWSQDEVSWWLTKGEALKNLHGTYSCVDQGDGTTKVEYRLDIELAIPMVSILRKRGEKVVVDSALKGLKRRVEG